MKSQAFGVALALLGSLIQPACSSPVVPEIPPPPEPAIQVPLDYTEKPLEYGSVDKVVVVKSERRMYLMRGDEVLRIYRVSLGPNPRGPKIFSGDGRTPEGLYTLDRRNENSRFYRSFRISYPSYADMSRAYSYGASPGGMIMVHGQPRDRFNGANPYYDWTEGCIALSNREMDEFMLAVTEGTPIEILP